MITTANRLSFAEYLTYSDYKAKRSEYSILDIPEYWVVDPLANKVTIFILAEGWYEPTKFQGNEIIQSPTFPELRLAVDLILDRDFENP